MGRPITNHYLTLVMAGDDNDMRMVTEELREVDRFNKHLGDRMIRTW